MISAANRSATRTVSSIPPARGRSRGVDAEPGRDDHRTGAVVQTVAVAPTLVEPRGEGVRRRGGRRTRVLVYGISADRAFDLLVSWPQETNTRLRILAERIVAGFGQFESGASLRTQFDRSTGVHSRLGLPAPGVGGRSRGRCRQLQNRSGRPDRAHWAIRHRVVSASSRGGRLRDRRPCRRTGGHKDWDGIHRFDVPGAGSFPNVLHGEVHRYPIGQTGTHRVRAESLGRLGHPIGPHKINFDPH